MSKQIIAKKIGMTRAFTDGGTATLTVVQAMPNSIISTRTMDKDGYDALRLGTGVRKSKHTNKPLTGQIGKSESAPLKIYEFRTDKIDVETGQKVDVGQFEKDDTVIVSGITKGKGFAGNIKRHGYHRGPTTHGSDHHRAPGSIGSAYPQRVFKGKKMAGHLGNVTSVTQSKVFGVVNEDNIILLHGSLPGPKGSWLKIKSK